jgi:hypothetical protein
MRATLKGEIHSVNDTVCTQRGFDLGIATGVYTIEVLDPVGSYGAGAFSITKSDLDQTKTYYFRAKAYNINGWGYGSELSFSKETVVIGTVTTTSMVALVPLHARGFKRIWQLIRTGFF